MEFGPVFRAMSKNKFGVGLLVLEIAFTIAIVLNCLHLIGEQKQKINRVSGLDEEHMITVEVRSYGEAYNEAAYLDQVVVEDLKYLRSQPGIIDATVITQFPLIGGGSSNMMAPLGASRDKEVRCVVYSADEHFVSAMGLELMEGRTFQDSDLLRTSNATPANVIVTKALADALFPESDALGKKLGDDPYADTIVGIIKHMHTPYNNGDPMEKRVIFYPRRSASASMTRYLIRTEPGPYAALLAGAEKRLFSNHGERLLQVRPLLEIKRRGYMLENMLVAILTVVSFLLVFVTGIGILGMTSFSVTRRTRQIGVRRALGASKADIVRYFLLENSMIAAFGITLGLVGAFFLNRMLMQLMNGSPMTLWLALAGVLFIWLLGLLATLAPALRGSRIQPAIATRVG